MAHVALHSAEDQGEVIALKSDIAAKKLKVNAWKEKGEPIWSLISTNSSLFIPTSWKREMEAFKDILVAQLKVTALSSQYFVTTEEEAQT